MPNTHLNPDTLFTPEGNSYTQVVTSTGATTIHVAGQVAVRYGRQCHRHW